MNEPDKLAERFCEELRKEFIENHIKGDDVYESMLKGMATVLANIYRELWRDKE